MHPELVARWPGCVSTTVLKRQLQIKGINDAGWIIRTLKLEDFGDYPAPGFAVHHKGRSFYTEEAFQRAEADTDRAAEAAGDADQEAEADEEPAEEAPRQRRENRREEARLVTYVRDALEDLYASEYGPEADVAFDVHNQRPGNDYENVDVLAVQWRSEEVVDLVAVEVKLHFTARLVQQANNYRRFSDLVWIAVPVRSRSENAAMELRYSDPRLFDYVIDLGLGVLACRRTRGSSYEVLPVQWPRQCRPERLERASFIERHRTVFESAGVVEPRSQQQYPKIK